MSPRNFLQTLIKSLRSATKVKPSDRPYLYISLGLHLVIVIVFLVSWESVEPAKPSPVPQSIQARVLSASELKALAKKEEKKVVKPVEKKVLPKSKPKKTVEKKKIEKKPVKKKDKPKKVVKKDVKPEPKVKPKPKEKIAPKKEIKKPEPKKEDVERLENEKKLQELAAKAKREERERLLAEKLKEPPTNEPISEKDNEVLGLKDKLAVERELNERDKYAALIRDRIASKFHRIPGFEGKSARIRVDLTPTGEVVSSSIVKSSGDSAFDRAALNAVRSIDQFPMTKNIDVFEEYFRRFVFIFSPMD